MENRSRYYVVGAGLILTALVCVLVFWMALRQDNLIKGEVREQADALFDSIVLMRRWNSGHGGVYVEKKPGEISNPYLDDPDITDTEGVVYTLKNPALMTREISEYAERAGGFRFHITSLKLKNPGNRPDAWERRALESFGKGKTEAAEAVPIGGKLYYRLMRPLYVEESCLACHGCLGYKPGDVRGGISVTLPYDSVYRAARANFMGMAGLAVMLVLVFSGVLYFFVWRLMDRLERQKRALSESNDTKEHLMGMAAHDLRNPLVVVSGYTELLEGMVDDASQTEILDGIRGSTDKMVGMIDGMLDASRIRSGRLDLKVEEVEVAGFIRDCVSFNELIGRKKGIAFVSSVHGEVGSARFDRDRMHQVVDNLLSNAFKFSEPGTTVTLGADLSADGVNIWVQDEGVGISGEELPSIFDEFTTAHARPTGGEPSHGLGLAIVKRIVELHGGSISARSRQGEGTRVTITLPRP